MIQAPQENDLSIAPMDLTNSIDLKRITRCKLASIFTSADYRKFLGLFGAMFGSEAARL